MPRKTAAKKNGTKKNGNGKKQYAPAFVELTDVEIADRSNQLALLLSEIEAHKDALKIYNKDERTQIGEKEQRLSVLRDAVLEGKEQRDVEVEVSVRGGQVTTIRTDTGEVLETREATDEDKQAGLFG